MNKICFNSIALVMGFFIATISFGETNRNIEITTHFKSIGADVHINKKGQLRSLTITQSTKVKESDLVYLNNMPFLVNLEIQNAFLEDEMVKNYIQSIHTLEVLILSDSNISDTSLKYIGTMINLSDLDLSSTRITDDGLKDLAGLKNLSGLKLNHTKITDKGLVHLEKITSLEEISLLDTKITAEGGKKLEKALKATVRWKDSHYSHD
jgi:internalin A